MDLMHYLFLALILFAVFLIYLLFTQPANALWLAERILVVVWTVLSAFIKGLFIILTAIGRGIGNIVRSFRR